MPASAPANRLALRLIAAGAALLTAGAASAQPIRLPPLRPRSAPAAPAPAAPETVPARPAPLSPMQLSKALAKVSPNLPPPNLAAAVRLTWDAPSSSAAWLATRGSAVVAQPGASYARTLRPEWNEVFLQAQAGKTYVVDCAVKRTGFSEPAAFGYQIDRDGTFMAGQGDVITTEDHLVIAIPPGPGGRMHLMFMPKQVAYGWYWYGCDVAPAG